MTERMSVAELRAVQEPSKSQRYSAQRTTVDGITFDSKPEAKRWAELKLLEQTGEIIKLRRQGPVEAWSTPPPPVATPPEQTSEDAA